MPYTVRVNGTPRELDVAGDKPLLWSLREDLNLLGTKFGCGIAQCGACTVHIDGKPQRSCSVPISAIKEREVTTIEAVDGREFVALRAAWIHFNVPQCGYCQSGQLMSAVALLKANPKPNDQEIESAMAGNICRCGSYPRIRAAIA